MVEEEVIRFKHAYLQMKIDKMKTFTEEYKKSIDKCNPAGISSAALFIGELGEKLKNEKEYLTGKQEDEIDNLNREYAIQFQRLNIDRVNVYPKLKNKIRRKYNDKRLYMCDFDRKSNEYSRRV